MEQIADHDGLEDVELKVTLRSSEGGGGLVTEYLGADHGEGLALCGVDLAGHDGRTGLVLGQLQLTKTASGSGTEEADVLGDLEEGGCEGVELAMGLDDGIVGSEGFELVGCGDEVLASHLADFCGNVFGEALECVDTSSDGCSTLCQHLEARETGLYPLNAKVELLYVSRELLAESQRGSILEMCPANLDQVLPLVDLLLQRIAEAGEGGKERLLEVEHGGDVHDGGEGVVGGGGHVDVVVGVDWLLAAHCAAEDLDGAVGDDFVRVHVGLGARASLPHHKREVVDELEGGHLVSGLLDGLSELGVCMGVSRVAFAFFNVPYPAQTSC